MSGSVQNSSSVLQLMFCAKLKFCASISATSPSRKSLPSNVGSHLNSNNMSKLITDRNLIIVNFAIVSYFILIWLISFYKIDLVLIGVFVELLTIPFLIAQIVFLVIGIRHLIKDHRNQLTVISVLLLAVCNVITIGSFF